MNPRVKELAEPKIFGGEYTKNIHYMWAHGANSGEFQRVTALGGMPGQTQWVMTQAHYKVGVQMQVSKQVSDDLLASDFGPAAKIENVPWVSPVVELYFEDPKLPTMLVMKTNQKLLSEWFPHLPLEVSAPEYISCLMQEGNHLESAKLLNVQLRPEMYDEFLENGVAPNQRMGIMSVQLDDADNAVSCYMLHLALKVFAFVHSCRCLLSNRLLFIGSKCIMVVSPT
jgi:hypothetical protein